MTVTEPFVILPSNTVYLLPTSQYKFELAKVNLKNGEMDFNKISLPSPKYEWNVDAEDKGMIGEDGMFISKDKEGMVNIHVVELNIPNNTAEASVKVVYPYMVDLEIVDVTTQMKDSNFFLDVDYRKPFSKQLGITEWDTNWIMVEGHYYYIKIFLFDREKHPIELTENLVFQINL